MHPPPPHYLGGVQKGGVGSVGHLLSRWFVAGSPNRLEGVAINVEAIIQLLSEVLAEGLSSLAHPAGGMVLQVLFLCLPFTKRRYEPSQQGCLQLLEVTSPPTIATPPLNVSRSSIFTLRPFTTHFCPVPVTS